MQQYPRVSNDMLPSNMPTFSMPIRAGSDGMLQFRYHAQTKTLYTDLRASEDAHGMPAQIDNVKITADATIPELQNLWELTAANRAMYDAEHIRDQEDADDDLLQGDSEPVYQSTELPKSPPNSFESHFEGRENVNYQHDLLKGRQPPQNFDDLKDGMPPVVQTAEEFVGELFTRDQVKMEIQRENDRLVIRTLKMAFDQCADSKDKMIPIIDILVKTNEEMYQRNFGEYDDEGINEN